VRIIVVITNGAQYSTVNHNGKIKLNTEVLINNIFFPQRNFITTFNKLSKLKNKFMVKLLMTNLWEALKKIMICN